MCPPQSSPQKSFFSYYLVIFSQRRLIFIFLENLFPSDSFLAPDTFKSSCLQHKSRFMLAYRTHGPSSLMSSPGRRFLCVVPLFSDSIMKLISSRNEQFSASFGAASAHVQLSDPLLSFKNTNQLNMSTFICNIYFLFFFFGLFVMMSLACKISR